jgi:hypothetical protein
MIDGCLMEKWDTEALLPTDMVDSAPIHSRFTMADDVRV